MHKTVSDYVHYLNMRFIRMNEIFIFGGGGWR